MSDELENEFWEIDFVGSPYCPSMDRLLSRGYDVVRAEGMIVAWVPKDRLQRTWIGLKLHPEDSLFLGRLLQDTAMEMLGEEPPMPTSGSGGRSS